MISVQFQSKPLNITLIQVYGKTINAKEAEVEWFYEDTQDLSRTNTPKRCPFHHRGLECKSRKLRGTWSNRQIWLWSTKWSRSKANRILPRECTGRSKHPLHTRDNSTHGHHQIVNNKIRLIILFAVKDGEALRCQQKQDQGLTLTQIMNSLLQISDLNWRK